MTHDGITELGCQDDLTPSCSCGQVWRGHPNPHALTCPLHKPVRAEAARQVEANLAAEAS